MVDILLGSNMAHIRDEEIKRLEKYAQGLGTKIKYEKYKRGDPGAMWVINGDGTTELTCYVWPRQSKIKLILNIVHELGHHLAWVYSNRTENPKTFDAFHKEDLRKKDTDPKLPKKERKLIYLSEKEDAKYRDSVWHEVGIKIPKWKLDMDKELDIWGYKMYYLRGNHPNIKEIYAKKRELMGEKYGSQVQKDTL